MTRPLRNQSCRHDRTSSSAAVNRSISWRVLSCAIETRTTPPPAFDFKPDNEREQMR